jgi:carotenoid cleavage dioxygenase
MAISIEREQAAGHNLWAGIQEPMSNNASDAPLKDTANTDVIFYNCQLLALWYFSGKPIRVMKWYSPGLLPIYQ